MIAYSKLLDQRELRDSGASTGIDAEYVACHYLISRGDFKWALRWDDLELPSAYRWQRTEFGIDVVAEHIDGSIWALQVKDYQKYVGYSAFTNMSAFVTSGRRRGARIDRLAILCADAPASRNLIDKCAEENTVIFDRTDLAKYSWPSMNAIKRAYDKRLKTTDPSVVKRRLALPKNAPKRLWKHQRECVAALRKHFQRAKRARAYMVTAAGKTITFVKLAEGYDNVLVVVPRLLLAQQTYEKFIQQTKVKYDHILFVASENIGARYDDLKPSDLTGRNTTDAEEIAEFMRLPGRKLIISTYKSSCLIKEAKAKIDLAIFDEAHHAAGFTYKGDKLKQAQALLHYRGIKRHVFFTATPRIYTSDIKQAAANGGHYVASLDNVLTFGKLVYEFSYDQALHAPQPVVKPYEIRLVVLKDDEYRAALREKRVKDAASKRNHVSSHIVAALAQARVVKAEKLHHGIGFANKVDNANLMRNYYFEFVGNHFAETLSSLRTVDDNKRALTQFEEGPEGFITNVNILSEGMDAPCVDYIVFADPMKSKHAIAQKIGRGLRYDPTNPDAKLVVIVPIILEADNSVETTKFTPILEVLGAMSSMDKTLAVEIDEIARNLPSNGSERRFKVDADLPLIDVAVLQQTISTAVFSATGLSWDAQWMAALEAVKEIYAESGTLPAQNDDSGRHNPAGHWIARQRRLCRQGVLSVARREILDAALGASWRIGNIPVGSQLWWEKHIYRHGDVVPDKSISNVWYKQCYNARALFDAGEMDEAEQVRCREQYPAIWQWLRTPQLRVNARRWWETHVYCHGDIRPSKLVDNRWYAQALIGRQRYRRGEMSVAEQSRCRTKFPAIWAWLTTHERKRNTPDWWEHHVYCHGDRTPTRAVSDSWYQQVHTARLFYRDGQMSEAEQQRCRKQYPIIWAWLTA
jgi:predicted helicase